MRQSIKKNFLRITALHLVLLGLLVITLPMVHAAAAGVHPTVATTPIRPEGLPKTTADQGSIRTILSIVFGIIGAFAVLNITISGLKYITSAGNPQKISEAKNGIIFSLIGLVIAISAEAIVTFVVSRAS